MNSPLPRWGQLRIAHANDIDPDPERGWLPWDATKPGGFGQHLLRKLSADVRGDVRAVGKTVTAVVPCPTSLPPKG
ncbi:hypothetical protein [Streptomyces sp. NPDC006551]|uniref:hypothetical protein n=1 Tax=Streptomyces sp. NPDC006551 TaxID=3157178 RepID=UPI0033A4FC41